ncbi:hypothetical protein GEMRC1_008049 [Eukaryota sp. GEM-RC1]
MPSNIASLTLPCSIALRNSGTRTSALKILPTDEFVTASPDIFFVNPGETVRFSLTQTVRDVVSKSQTSLVLASVDQHVLSCRFLASSNNLPMASASNLLPSENLIKSFGHSTAQSIVEELNDLSSWKGLLAKHATVDKLVEVGSGTDASTGDRLYDCFYISNDFKRVLSITTIKLGLRRDQSPKEKIISGYESDDVFDRHSSELKHSTTHAFDQKSSL